MNIAEIKRYQLISELIREGLRLSIVSSLTGVSTASIGKLWKDIHGTMPTRGKLPDSILSFMRNQETAAIISSYAVFFQKAYGNKMTPENLLQSIRDFRALTSLPLDINAAFFANMNCNGQVFSERI
jgi:alanine-alpha-ketoisovalerate/valine-pyruvate aminotransferase